MENQVKKFEATRQYLKLGMRYTPGVEAKASRMKTRCETLKKREQDPLLYYAYEAVALLCDFILEGQTLQTTHKVKAEEMLEEVLDLYLQAGGYLDPLVKLHMPLLRKKLNHPLKETLRIHRALIGTVGSEYTVFYSLVIQTLNFVFHQELATPSVA